MKTQSQLQSAWISTQPFSLRTSSCSKFTTLCSFTPRLHSNPLHSPFRVPCQLLCTATPPSSHPTPSPPTKPPSFFKSNFPLYLSILAAQSLPFVFPTSPAYADLLYFILTAPSCLILGCRRAVYEPLQMSAPLTSKQALLAPFIASTFLFTSYLLLKHTPLDISLLFNLLTTVAATLCLKETLDPILHALLTPLNLSSLTLRTPLFQDSTLPPPTPTSPHPTSLPSILSAAISATATTAYLTHLPPTYLFSNLLAVAICTRVVSLIRPNSFRIAAALLCGLVLYDIFWVFGSEVMVSVATQIDSPAKLLFPRAVSETATKYPYAILGLGDICVPGIFVTLAQSMDQKLASVKEGEEPYFRAAVWAYVLGLVSCFGVNMRTHAAQPALLYLVPMLIGSVVGVAWVRGEVPDVLQFRVEEKVKLEDGK